MTKNGDHRVVATLRVENKTTEKLLSTITQWIQTHTSSPEFREFKTKQIAYTLTDEWERHLGIQLELPAEFTFAPEIENQHALIMAFFYLRQAQSMLTQCEYYFRRFPFRDLPVSRDDHARNICEFYFSCFYIIRSRFKEVLNKLKAACPDSKIDIGRTLGTFDKTFDQELRARNSIHHRSPFDDVSLDRILLSRIFAESENGRRRGWEQEHRSAYREFSKVWSRRARERARVMESVVDILATAILSEASFLQTP